MRGLHKMTLAFGAVLLAASCGSRDMSPTTDAPDLVESNLQSNAGATRTSIWDVLRSRQPEQRVNVNRYIWRASLDVLNFLPIQTVDPYTGVIVTGFGTPPGGGQAYRATVLINDPALEARSLNLALATRSGPVSGATQRAVEDAILARARQLRKADSRL